MDSNIEGFNKALTEINSTYQITRQITELEFEISLPLPIKPFLIRIRFPEDFPKNPPTILSSNIMSHPKIDIFGIIFYKEYYNWSPEVSLMHILRKLCEEFNNKPPVLLTIHPYPNFIEYLSRSKPIQSEKDAQDLIHSTEEFKAFTVKTKKHIEDNIQNAKDCIRMKERYNTLCREASGGLNEQQELVSRLERARRAANNISQQKFSSERIMQSLREKEKQLQNSSGEIYNRFLHKEITLQEFTEQYKNAVKEQKIVQMIKDNI